MFTRTVVAAASFLVLSSAHYVPRAAETPPPAGPRIAALPGAGGAAPLFLLPPSAAAAPAPNPGSAPAQGSASGPRLLAATSSRYGIPATVLDAYKRAEAGTAGSDPGCHMSWPLLAAIGQVEAGQARGGDVDGTGRMREPILGPALSGNNGNAAIANSFGHRYDQQGGQWMRAVGPMQFLPSTWTKWGADGNGDGNADPQNVYDAALAASHYLCADGRDMASPSGLQAAILSYNHSQHYLNTVVSWMRAFGQGGVAVPDQPDTGSSDQPADPPTSSASSQPSAPAGDSGSSGTSEPSSESSESSSGGSEPSSDSSGPDSDGSTPSAPAPSPAPAPEPEPSAPLQEPVEDVTGTVSGVVGGP